MWRGRVIGQIEGAEARLCRRTPAGCSWRGIVDPDDFRVMPGMVALLLVLPGVGRDQYSRVTCSVGHITVASFLREVTAGAGSCSGNML